MIFFVGEVEILIPKFQRILSRQQTSNIEAVFGK